MSLGGVFPDLNVGGRMQATLELGLKERDGTLDMRASGSLTLRDVTLRNAITGKLFGGIRRLTAEAFRWESEARLFEADSLLVDKARLGLVLSADSRLDLPDALVKRRGGVERNAKTSSGLADGTDVFVKRIRVQDGAVAFPRCAQKARTGFVSARCRSHGFRSDAKEERKRRFGGGAAFRAAGRRALVSDGTGGSAGEIAVRLIDAECSGSQSGEIFLLFSGISGVSRGAGTS